MMMIEIREHCDHAQEGKNSGREFRVRIPLSRVDPTLSLKPPLFSSILMMMMVLLVIVTLLFLMTMIIVIVLI